MNSIEQTLVLTLVEMQAIKNLNYTCVYRIIELYVVLNNRRFTCHSLFRSNHLCLLTRMCVFHPFWPDLLS